MFLYNKVINEYFINGVWTESCYRTEYDKFPRRNTVIYPTWHVNASRTYHLHEHFMHRLDGPYSVDVLPDLVTEIIVPTSNWAVNNVIVLNFKNYYNFNDPADSVFKYLEKHKEFIPQIVILARHNKWLSEEQILLLETAILFV
jgi:hypothetical protein